MKAPTQQVRRMSWLRLLPLLGWPVGLLCGLVLIVFLLVDEDFDPRILMVLGLLCLVSWVAIVQLVFSYLAEDRNKVIRKEGATLIISKKGQERAIDIGHPDVIVTAVKTGGYRNPLIWYGFVEVRVSDEERHYVTALFGGPERIARWIRPRYRLVAVRFPRLGLDTRGRGEELIDTLGEKVGRNIEAGRKQEHAALVIRFKKKFAHKSNSELKRLANSPRLADYARQAAAELLKNRPSA